MSQVVQIDRSRTYGFVDYKLDPNFTPNWLNGWGWGEQDYRSLMLTELDFSRLSLRSMHENGETSLSLLQRYGRLMQAQCILPDIGVFWTVWQNRHLLPSEWKRSDIIITFDGTTLYNQFSVGCVPVMWWYSLDEEKAQWYCDIHLQNKGFLEKHLALTISLSV